MLFPGPEQADFRDVQAINREFLRRLRVPKGAALRRPMPPPLRPVIAGLTDVHVSRLCCTPFLLLSVRESDEPFWAQMWDGEPDSDLFAAEPDTALGQLAAASLAFLWQLSRRNPYAARLMSGATLRWCEQLADRSLCDLLQRMAGRQDLLQLRRAGDAEFWHKLLGPGVSSVTEVRQAAQLSSLQMLLTGDPPASARSRPAAACSTERPSKSFAT